MDDIAEVREIFNKVITSQTDPDKRSNLEICREYFTNESYRKWLEDFTATLNGLK